MKSMPKYTYFAGKKEFRTKLSAIKYAKKHNLKKIRKQSWDYTISFKKNN